MSSSRPHVCPWWLAYAFDNPLRRLLHDPERMLRRFVRPGDTALDVGCGMGYFTIPLAHLVGATGRVIAADLQPQMLDRVRRRTARAGVLDRVRFHQCRPDSLGLEEPVDFALAFWMVHEVPDIRRFLEEIRTLLRPRATLLIVEPRGHVALRDFEETVRLAGTVGLVPSPAAGEVRVAASRAVALVAAG